MYDQRWSEEWVEQEFDADYKDLIFQTILRELTRRRPAKGALLDIGAHAGRFMALAQGRDGRSRASSSIRARRLAPRDARARLCTASTRASSRPRAPLCGGLSHRRARAHSGAARGALHGRRAARGRRLRRDSRCRAASTSGTRNACSRRSAPAARCRSRRQSGPRESFLRAVAARRARAHRFHPLSVRTAAPELFPSSALSRAVRTGTNEVLQGTTYCCAPIIL